MSHPTACVAFYLFQSFWVHFILLYYVHLINPQIPGEEIFRCLSPTSFRHSPHTVFLKNTIRASTGPGIDVKFATLFQAEGLGGRLAPGRSRAKPWWGSRRQSPRKLLNFRDFVGFKTYLPTCIFFYYISLMMNTVKLIKYAATFTVNPGMAVWNKLADR